MTPERMAEIREWCKQTSAYGPDFLNLLWAERALLEVFTALEDHDRQCWQERRDGAQLAARGRRG